MKQIPEHLRNEIIKANKERNRLNKEFVKVETEISDINFNRIEVKLSKEELDSDKQYSILKDHFDEYAYFYHRYDGRMGAEKIKNGKLKEYYDSIINFNLRENIKAEKFASLEELKTKKLKNLFSGFYLNNTYFYLNYCSFDAETNEITDYYFYCKEFKFHDEFDFLQNDELRSTLILRFDASGNLNKIYIQSFDIKKFQKKFLESVSNVFYYINPKTFELENFLVSINFPITTDNILNY